MTASSSSSGKLADPTTTLPELPPWDSGLLPLELAPAAGLDELVPLEQAATAARATAARAAIAPVAPVLVRIWVSFRTVLPIRFCLPWPGCAGRPEPRACSARQRTPVRGRRARRRAARRRPPDRTRCSPGRR